MATTKDIRVEAMTDLLKEVGIEATLEQAAKIADDFAYHLDIEREMSGNQYAGASSECSNCKRLQSELKDVTKERDAYHQSVKTRRSASHVWIENGEVKYEK